jgi:NAD(P)-dependent dehydrogenase (short-subunit alcohol dehydrogenase family)
MKSVNPFSVVGKVIVVTGASSGIGQNVCVELGELGAIVVGIGRDESKLNLTSKLMKTSKQKMFIKADLTIASDLSHIVNVVRNSFSQVDGLVHCAGISSTILIKSISEKKVKNHFDINVFAPLALTREFLDRKVKLLGVNSRIIFISSVMDGHGATGKTLYGMTKGAIFAGVKSLAIELADKGIRVNSVSPSVINSPLSHSSYYMSNPETLKRVKEMHPLGIGSPEDVSFAIIYLLSEASKWVTGTNLIIDGGYSAV